MVSEAETKSRVECAAATGSTLNASALVCIASSAPGGFSPGERRSLRGRRRGPEGWMNTSEGT